MKVERLRPTTFRLTLHALELATLVSAARWATSGGEGELTDEAREQLRQVVENYDQQMERLGP